MRLTESDLKFVVETVATRRRDWENITHLVRDKEDLLEPMLEDPKLTERLVSEKEIFALVSPYLMFAVLLRRVRRDLADRTYVLERDTRGRRIPVFEAPETARLLGDPALREYLIEMLCSFVRTNSGVVYCNERGLWRKRKFSDLDMDDMIALCHLVDPTFKRRLYKRIADIALFLTGVYPDHAGSPGRKPRGHATGRRTTADYEHAGRRFYSRAAREPEPPWTATVFERMSEEFTLAREALIALSDRYLKPLRDQYFSEPAA